MKTGYLWRLTDQYTTQISRAADSLDWSRKETYGNWLAQTFYFVSHSTRLLTLAASRFDLRFDEQHTQLVQHAKEEKSHEKIARADLKALGLTLEELPELPATKAMYRSAYYLIERDHPMAIYGYVALLEVLSIKRGPALLEAAAENFGKNCTHFLRIHTEDDVEHIKMYEGLLASCEGPAQAAVAEAISCTGENFLRMLDEINAASRVRKLTKAA